MDDLARLAESIRTLNRVKHEIAAIIGRPAQIGHVGEYIASRIFDIVLEPSASSKGIDGNFVRGPLAGRSVNVKWYTKREFMLNITPDFLPDYYLVMTGPRTAPGRSDGTTRPWVIEAVYLFDAHDLVRELEARGVKIGVATSVRQGLWERAEIYPRQHNPALVLSREQKSALALFA